MAIMPGSAFASTETLTLTPEADTYVDAASPNTSFGSTRSVWVDAGPEKQSYMRFRLAGLSGRTVTSARLRLVQGDDSREGGRVVSISSTDWSEEITWNTRPAIDGSHLASFGAVARGNAYDVELGPLDPSDGVVALALDSNDKDGVKWYSREAGKLAPQLIVEVAGEPPPHSGTQLLYGFEDGDSAPLGFDDVNTITIGTDWVNSGEKAMRPGTNAYRSFHTETVVDEPTFYRFYAYWTGAPASGAAILAWVLSDPGRTTSLTIRVDALGRVSLRDARGAVGGQTGMLATESWHLIEFATTQSGDGGVGSLRVNGTDVATEVPGYFGERADDRLRLGQIGPTVLPGLAEDDVAASQPGGSWIGPVTE